MSTGKPVETEALCQYSPLPWRLGALLPKKIKILHLMGTTPGDVRTNLKANEGDFEKKCVESFMGMKMHAIVEGCLEVFKKTEVTVKAVEFIVFAGLN